MKLSPPADVSTPVRVLVAEDDYIVAADITRALRDLGYEVPTTVGTGADAVRAVREEDVDLVLMDIRMPGTLDGVEAAEQIAEETGLPVVYLTAYSDEMTLSRVVSSPAHGYLLKPFDVGDLKTSIELAVSQHRRAEREARSRRWASRDRFETLFHASPAGVAVTRASDGTILDANRSFVDILGYRRSEVLERTTTELGIVDDAVRSRVREALTREERVVFEDIALGRRDGSEAVVLASVDRIELDGEACLLIMAQDITQRRRAEEALAQSEGRFRQIAERIDDIFWISSPDKDKMEYVSPAYREIMGYPPGELYEDPTRWIQHIHREDRLGVIHALPDQLDGSYEEEYRIVRPDGEIRWIWDRAFPVLDAEGEVSRIVGVAEDITERVRRRQEIEKLAAFPESNPNPVVELSSRGNPRFLNTAAQELARTLGVEGPEILPEDTRQIASSCLERGEPIKYVERKVENRVVSWSFFPVPRHEVVYGHGADITDRRSLEHQLRQSQKLEAVGRLASGIAHDFNNLLTVIRSQADLIHLDLASSSPLADEVELIRESADRAARLTNQLLAFSREQVLQPRNVNLNEILRGMEELLVRTLGEHIEIVAELEEGLPAIRVDAGQLEQVVMNLAVNARDAMPGGGRLRIRTTLEQRTPVDGVESVVNQEEGELVRLEVSDTGEGIPDEVRGKVFEPFFTTKQDRGGSGLGLATCYGIVRQSGGSIEVESEVGEGTTFNLRFPAVEGEVQAGRPSAPTSGGSGDLSGTVLLVEDDPSVRTVARKILERAGLDVVTAGDGHTAKSVLDREAHEIDLVLTDLVLPELSGRDLVDWVRDRSPQLPLVVMSGYTEGSPGTRGDLPPEVTFIQKPFSPAGLLNVVREGLRG